MELKDSIFDLENRIKKLSPESQNILNDILNGGNVSDADRDKISEEMGIDFSYDNLRTIASLIYKTKCENEKDPDFKCFGKCINRMNDVFESILELNLPSVTLSKKTTHTILESLKSEIDLLMKDIINNLKIVATKYDYLKQKNINMTNVIVEMTSRVDNKTDTKETEETGEVRHANNLSNILNANKDELMSLSEATSTALDDFVEEIKDTE